MGGAACSLQLLLRFIQGCCAVAASKSNIARSILYFFLDQLLLNHSIFVLITRPFLSELFTTSPLRFPFLAYRGSSPDPPGISELCLQTAGVSIPALLAGQPRHPHCLCEAHVRAD